MFRKIHSLYNEGQLFFTARHLKRLRRRMQQNPQTGSSLEQFNDYRLRIIDGPDFYIQYKDFFVRQIYRFEAKRPDPFIIDCGSNIGMSILYFKQLYPQSRMIGFEPDPCIFKVLSENVQLNKLSDVILINAGLGSQKGSQHFLADGKSGGRVAIDPNGIKVRIERLSEHIHEPVDFLKMNIEGAEESVLKELAGSGKLQNIQEMVLEYHGWPYTQQSLGNILNLLDQEGFRYLIHDFDSETCGTSKPPFHLQADTRWFCLVYARRYC